MKVLSYSAIALAVLASTSSMAALQVGESTTNFFQSATHPAAISAEIGTLGYGANIAWGVNDSTELQAGWSGITNTNGDIKIDITDSDSIINWKKVASGLDGFQGNIKYDVKSSNPYLGVQMRPFKNSFTIGTGVMVPKNEINASITSTNVKPITVGGTKQVNASPITINGKEFYIPEGSNISVHAENKNRLAPYATLGFRPNINARWGAFAEIGGAYMGNSRANVQVNVDPSKVPDVIGVDDNGKPIRGQQAITELRQTIEKDTSANLWYPIAKVGLTMRF